MNKNELIHSALKKRRRTGRRGERKAVQLLRSKGYKIIDRNIDLFTGEIDIAALDGNTLVFVEVKSRSRTLYRPSSGWSPAQRGRLLRCAAIYRHLTGLQNIPIRIELVEVVFRGIFCVKINHRTADPLPAAELIRKQSFL